MRYHFTRVWAHILVVAGIMLMAAGIVSALAVSMVGLPVGAVSRFPTAEAGPVRVVIAILVASGGLLFGGALIVSGQLMLIFLDQRQLLIAQYRLLRRIRTGLALRDRESISAAESSRPVERLRPRR